MTSAGMHRTVCFSFKYSTYESDDLSALLLDIAAYRV